MSPPIHPLTSSQGAVFLINSRQGYFSCVLHPCGLRKALYRRYGRFFAEFLGDISLVRLGLLALTTCVGLRYGLLIINLRSFSWKRALQTLLCRSSRLSYCLDLHLSNRADLPTRYPYSTNIKSINVLCILHFVTPSNINRCRNINLLSIGCGFRHSLRPD